MKNFTKKMLGICVLAGTAMTAHAESAYFDFSYVKGEPNYEGVGVKGPTTYSVAIRIYGNESLIGKQIVGITAPVINDGASNFSCWLTSLPLPSTNYAPDIVEKKGELVKGDYYGTVTVDLDEPYTITEKGVFVGYTFTIASASTQMEQYPVLCSGDPQSMSLYLACTNEDRTKVEMAWMDGSTQGLGASGIVVHMLDTDAPTIGATASPANCYALRGATAKAEVEVLNQGAEPLTTAEFTLSVDGKETVVTATAAKPIQYFSNGNMTFEFEAPETPGSFTGTLKLNKLNGTDFNGATSDFKVTTVTSMPQRRPFMEELTSTGCGPCARSYAGLEALREAVPDAIIAAYHTDVNWVDPMHLKSDKPGYVFTLGGVPDGNLDRCHPAFDPYYGYSGYPLAVIDDYKAWSQTFTPVDIDVDASWADAEKSAINVKSTVIFRALPEDDDYLRIVYTLTADGLSGTSKQWSQNNAYKGQPAESYPGMDIFTSNRTGIVSGLTFNDVAVFKSGSTGIEKSLPDYYDIELDKPYTHEYTIKIADCVNTANKPIIQNIDMVTVIATVLEQPTRSSGFALNSAQKRMYGAGIQQVADNDINKQVVGTVYYDLAGRQVTNPQKGIYVRISKYADGTSKSDKVAIK